jgi:hypothetical protein
MTAYVDRDYDDKDRIGNRGTKASAMVEEKN